MDKGTQHLPPDVFREREDKDKETKWPALTLCHRKSADLRGLVDFNGTVFVN